MIFDSKKALEEFIARGGQIKKLECIRPEEGPTVSVKSTGPATVYTLSEGEILFGKKRDVKKGKEKKTDDDFLRAMREIGIDLEKRR